MSTQGEEEKMKTYPMTEAALAVHDVVRTAVDDARARDALLLGGHRATAATTLSHRSVPITGAGVVSSRPVRMAAGVDFSAAENVVQRQL